LSFRSVARLLCRFECQGLTRWRLRRIAARLRAFEAAGGGVVAKAASDAELEEWAAEVDDYYHYDFLGLPAQERNPELDAGVTLLWGALTTPPCFVAVAQGVAMAALAYRVVGQVIEVEAVGSRQVVPGAGTAVEVALARLGLEWQAEVRGTYRPAARGFHVAMGRRLDEGPGLRKSRWSVKDCRRIVERCSG
jgi:hypothetical protein